MHSSGRWPLDADDRATFAEHRAVDADSPTVSFTLSCLLIASPPASGVATEVTSASGRDLRIVGLGADPEHRRIAPFATTSTSVSRSSLLFEVVAGAQQAQPCF